MISDDNDIMDNDIIMVKNYRFLKFLPAFQEMLFCCFH